MGQHRRLSLWAPGLVFIVAVAYLAITTNFSYRGSWISAASARPVLAPRLDELSFDSKCVTVRVSVENLGKSAGIVECLRIIAYDGSGQRLWYSGMEGAIISPGGTSTHVFRLARPDTISGFTFDPKESIAKLGRLPVTLSYSSRELPEGTLEEETAFSHLRWQDKSVVGADIYPQTSTD